MQSLSRVTLWVGAAFLGMAFSGMAISGARADVRYTTEMTMGDGADKTAASDNGRNAGRAPAFRTTKYIKDNREREETSMQMGPMQMNTVTLTLCDKKQSIKMDPALKIYTISPIGAMSFGAPTPSAGRAAMGRNAAADRASAEPSGPVGTGKVVTTFTVQDLGSEKISALTAKHSMITIRTQQSGCPGNSDTTMKMEIWTAPVKTLVCPERWTPGAPSDSSPSAPTRSNCKISYEMKGDVDKMKDVFSGMIVRQKMYNGDKVVMVQDMREYSLAPLKEDLFSPPADYKQVTEEEFSRMQQDAMMKAFTRGARDAARDAANQAAASAAENEANSVKTDAEASAPAVTDGSKTENPDESKPEEGKKKKRPRIKIPGLPF